MMEIIPEGATKKVWCVVDDKTRKELGYAESLKELTEKYGREGVIYSMRWDIESVWPQGGAG